MKKLTKKLIASLIIFTLTVAPLGLGTKSVFADETPSPSIEAQTPPPAATAQPAATQPPAPTTAPATPATPKPAATPKTSVVQPSGTSLPTIKPTSTREPSTPATPQPAQTAIPSVLDAQSTPAPSVAPAPGITTGGQSGNSQTGDSNVTTGDANVNGSVLNSVNSNIGNSPSGSNGVDSSSNSGNGSNSDNNSQSNNNNSSDQALQNAANLSNNVAVGAETGSNDANRNTGDATVLTGDANVGVTVINGANNNISGLEVNQYDVNGDATGDIALGSAKATASCGGASNACANGVVGSSASNAGNGSESSNSAGTNSDKTSSTTMSNDAEVVNDVVIDATTGRNNANSNVGSGNIETGDANVAVTVLNFLNNNIIAGTVDVINIFGNYVGNIILPSSSPSQTNTSGVAGNNAAGNNASGNSVSNKQNGASSSNSADTNSSSTANTSQANVADIQNGIDVNANTGNNTVKSNNNDNAIQTGSTNVSANVYNVSNINTADGGYIVLVNDNGKWRGTIYGPNSNGKGTASASQGVDFEVLPDGTVVATNKSNGADSTNNASANSDTTSNTSQSNNAKVSNNVTINADTGNNSASRNVGGGTVKTGDVNVGASIMNFVNNNFIGQTFRVVMVNVLGKWSGNVVPAGTAPTPAVGGANTANQNNKPNTQATNSSPQATTAPTSAEAEQLVAQSPSVGKVLGTMTVNNSAYTSKIPAQITLDDGSKYYVDDTLAIPAEKPIIAAAVGVNKQVAGAYGAWWLYSLALLPLTALLAIKRIKKNSVA